MPGLVLCLNRCVTSFLNPEVRYSGALPLIFSSRVSGVYSVFSEKSSNSPGTREGISTSFDDGAVFFEAVFNRSRP